MKSVWIGIATIIGNNLIDGIVFVCLLRKHLELKKAGKYILNLFFLLWHSAILSAILYVNRDSNLVIYNISYYCSLLAGIFLLPLWLNKSQILKYVYCYALWQMWMAVISYGVYGASILFTGEMEVYFYTNDTEKLPFCFCMNLVYAILFYVGYRILNVIMRSYRRKSKVQNGLAIGYMAFMVASTAPMYYTVILHVIEGVAAYMLMYAGVLAVSLLFFIVAVYQNGMLEREKNFILRQRQEEESYYKKLMENQFIIRKMRHDMLDYIQTVKLISGDEARKKELLEELEGRLRNEGSQ